VGFYKHYKNRKDRRKQYRDSDSRSVDCTCKNHGTCKYCCAKRMFFDTKRRVAADIEMERYFKGED